jgi:hypothetical protein
MAKRQLIIYVKQSPTEYIIPVDKDEWADFQKMIIDGAKKQDIDVFFEQKKI